MKIIQITAVIEGTTLYNGEYGPDDEATIYGLGDDNTPYYWGRTKSRAIQLDPPDEEGDSLHYEYDYGWKPVQP
jgi:hypothetical protein